jgi:hypothetical protein
MTDIKEKALALLNEVRAERGYQTLTAIYRDTYMEAEALFRAVEQNEAFKQEVSDAVENVETPMEIPCTCGNKYVVTFNLLDRFIIPKPKPDPLVEVLVDVLGWCTVAGDVAALRAELEARGLEIREKGQ